MKRTIIRYKTKPERTDENERLIQAVFAELKAASPEGVRYVVLKLGDGTFVHFVSTDSEAEAGVIPGLAAFGEFQRGIKERCLEPPQASDATIVGNYRMFRD